MMSPTFKTVVSTRYWHKLAGDRVQCDLCPRACRLKEGQTGFCFVRANKGGEVVLTTYGRSSGFCLDPIEKKPLYHFLPGTPTLSFGTAGCNLACKFCQNWNISKSRAMDQLANFATPEMIAQAAQRSGCRSVSYTYNDPVVFHEYAIAVAQACRAVGIKSVAVTAGYISPIPRQEFFSYMDAANVDLKAFSEDFYHKLTGSHLQPVLDTLTYIKHETKVWLEITTLLIPGANDSPAEIDALTQWIVEHLGNEVPIHFSAFHPDWQMRDKRPTPLATLTLARQIALNNGLQYAYTGNVHNPRGESTFCHHCGHLLISREDYTVSTWNLTPDGHCNQCHTPCAGIFAAQAGTWGARRVPVRLG